MCLGRKATLRDTGRHRRQRKQTHEPPALSTLGTKPQLFAARGAKLWTAQVEDSKPDRRESRPTRKTKMREFLNFNNRYNDDPVMDSNLDLLPGSPCVGVTEPNPVQGVNVTTDFDGGAPRDSSAPDIGAFEQN